MCMGGTNQLFDLSLHLMSRGLGERSTTTISSVGIRVMSRVVCVVLGRGV